VHPVFAGIALAVSCVLSNSEEALEIAEKSKLTLAAKESD